MYYQCRNVLCGSRTQLPPPQGTCKNCAAPMILVEDEFDEEDAIQDAVGDILDGFSRLLWENDVADSGSG